MNQDIVNLWLVLPAIAEMVDEQNLSRRKAMSKLKQMLGPAASDPYVKEAIARLQNIKSGLDWRAALGTECLSAMEESHKPSRCTATQDRPEKNPGEITPAPAKGISRAV